MGSVCFQFTVLNFIFVSSESILKVKSLSWYNWASSSLSLTWASRHVKSEEQNIMSVWIMMMVVVMMEGTSDIHVVVDGVDDDDGSSSETNGKCEWISVVMVSTIVFAAVPLIIYFQGFCVLYSPNEFSKVHYSTSNELHFFIRHFFTIFNSFIADYTLKQNIPLKTSLYTFISIRDTTCLHWIVLY